MHEEERKQKEAAKNNTKSGNTTADASKSAKASEPAASKKPTTPSPATPSTAKGTNTTLTYSWVAVDDMCQIQKSRGLYPGEFMAWFNCTASQTRLAFSVLHKSNKADKGTTILPDKRTFYVTEGSRFQVKFEEKIAKKIKESSK
jgi:CRISPR/Cas system CSM-associated protein Csm4 (group 5 of RAMP superfamily)